MERTPVRELLRLAQSSELKGDMGGAARLLEQASRVYLDTDRPGRAATLLRHALRLEPGRSDLEATLAQIEQPEEAPPPASGLLEMPQRGPVSADPSVECWCSFCCRPGAEAGAMIAGSSGAFICAACIQSAQLLLASKAVPGTQVRPAIPPKLPEPLLDGLAGIDLPLGPVVSGLDSPSCCVRPRAAARLPALGGESPLAAAVTLACSDASPAAVADDGLIPAAVVLSRELGWSLTEIRGLTAEERRQAVALVAPPRRRSRSAKGGRS